MKNVDLNSPSRRQFVKQAGLMAGVTTFLPGISPLTLFPDRVVPLKVHLFSKHLQFLDFQEMAEQLAKAGYDGVDLTVRSGGHVEPERVAEDLPRAVKAIRAAGLKSIVMATNVNDASNELHRKVLEVAADLGISHYRMEYYDYIKGKSMPESIEYSRRKINELADLNAELGIVGCYQNHAGTRMGSSLWELYAMLKESDTKNIGVQYDIRHATVEGGLNWSKGLELIRPWLHSFVIKDFLWTQTDGKWRPENVPFGKGMVDWPAYFKILKSYQIDVPVSLHMEYPLGGAERGRREITVDPQVVYTAMKQDLVGVRNMWREA